MTPMTKNEKTTILISSLALLISILHFLFTIPSIFSVFYSADVIGKNVYTNTEGKIIQNTFQITNSGNIAAEELEIKLVCRIEDSVEIIYSSNKNVTYSKFDGAKHALLKISHFVPNENIHIIVFSDESINKLNFFTKPNIVSIKHSKGLGKIDNDDKLVVYSKLKPEEVFDSIVKSSKVKK